MWPTSSQFSSSSSSSLFVELQRQFSSSRNVNVNVVSVNVFNRISLSRASHAGKRQPKKTKRGHRRHACMAAGVSLDGSKPRHVCQQLQQLWYNTFYNSRQQTLIMKTRTRFTNANNNRNNMNDDNEYTTYSHFDIEDEHVGL